MSANFHAVIFCEFCPLIMMKWTNFRYFGLALYHAPLNALSLILANALGRNEEKN
jgi:hypothetical protein